MLGKKSLIIRALSIRTLKQKKELKWKKGKKMKISKNFLRDLNKIYAELTSQFLVVKSLSRNYGYSIKAPKNINWAEGPQNTFGWYRRKSDAQHRVDVLNKGK